MSSLTLPSRVLSRQARLQASRLSSYQASWGSSWSRVIFNHKTSCFSLRLEPYASTTVFPGLLCRSYATKPGKPKAHTGRAAASKRKPAAATDDAVAGTPKKASPKKETSSRKAGARKPKRRTKSKAKSTTKPKATKKAVRKTLTDRQKASKANREARKKRKEIRSQALLDPPKRLPSSAYQVLHAGSYGTGLSLAENARAASAKYKSLSAAEMERLNHVANENRANNEAALKKWLSTFTPNQIREANVARNHLKRDAKQAGKRKTFRHLQDERLVKPNRPSFSYFVMDRYASGDLKLMAVSETSRLLAREWKALSPAQKKPFEDKASADRARYIDEYTTVYGMSPSAFRKGAEKPVAS